MVFLIIAIVVIGVAIIYGWIKAVNAIFNPLIKKSEARKRRARGEDNPYIQAHKIKMENDQMYEEYLSWLDKSGGDLPFDKWKTVEEIKAEKKIQDASFKRWRPGSNID